MASKINCINFISCLHDSNRINYDRGDNLLLLFLISLANQIEKDINWIKHKLLRGQITLLKCQFSSLSMLVIFQGKDQPHLDLKKLTLEQVNY